jgi:hypothetical protein
VLNLYVRLGFKFRDPETTFHFWSDGQSATIPPEARRPESAWAFEVVTSNRSQL